MADLASNVNAFNDMSLTLQGWGLDSLKQPLIDYIVENGADDVNRLMLWMYDRPEFKARFPAMADLAAKGEAISPDQYMAQEKAYTQVLRRYPIAASFFDQPEKDFHKLIAGQVSPQELSDRMENGYKKVANADPAVRQAFSEYFGVKGDDALAAYFIDPGKSMDVIVHQAKQAEIGGAAKMTVGNLDLNYAADLANRGVGFNEALTGFRKIQASKALFESMDGEATVGNTAISFTGGPTQTEGVQGYNPINTIGEIVASNTASLGADLVWGTNVRNQEMLQNRLAARKAQFEAPSQTATVNKLGETNLGSAD